MLYRHPEKEIRPLTSANRSYGCIRNPQHLKPEIFASQDAQKNSWGSLYYLHSSNVIYPFRRKDPVFPGFALQQDCKGYGITCQYYNNATVPSLLSCVDNTEVCDSEIGKCWQEQSAGSEPRAQKLEKSGREPTRADHARNLLLSALSGSTTCTLLSSAAQGSLEAASHCTGLRCSSLPQDQWIVEARRLFETSLAMIQISLLDIVQGNAANRHSGNEINNEIIPTAYRGMCNMGKFRSVGYRNVSVWGLFALLALAGGIAVASIRDGHGELWLMLAIRGFIRRLWKVIQVLPAFFSRVGSY